MIIAFLMWQYYLERVHDNPKSQRSRWTPPPLMKLSLWKRANGRMTVILIIGFLNWAAFLGGYFWAQVCIILIHCWIEGWQYDLALLPRVPQFITYLNNGAIDTYDDIRHFMQCRHCRHHSSYSIGLYNRWALRRVEPYIVQVWVPLKFPALSSLEALRCYTRWSTRQRLIGHSDFRQPLSQWLAQTSVWQRGQFLWRK